MRLAALLVMPRACRAWLALAYWALPALVVAQSASPTAHVSAPSAVAVEFNRDIRPILSDKCFQCHGPDQAQRQGKLRLDQEADALADHEGRRAISPGDPQQSEAYRRIVSTNADERMPPPESGKSLTAAEIALLDQWIRSGAVWQKHWSFLPLKRPQPPTVSRPDWVRNPIDNFAMARLDREGLSPAAEADRPTLLRRASLDLTGLPPSPAEVDAFLADRAPDAFENAVDRLLASPRYGERMAARWLDAARYADTNGYQSDGERVMWRWRDWVIDAFNNNMPFDRFTVEQLAGDLLPNATLSQKIATGFNRNHRGNAEGGIIPEEFQVEYVVDRVDTTATVWMGLTAGCGRCHDHKFDPLTQREYYRLFAFFNNVPERGRAVKFGNSPPMIAAPTAEGERKLAALDQRLQAAEQATQRLQTTREAAQAAWEREIAGAAVDWSVDDGLAAAFSFDGDLSNSAEDPPAPFAQNGAPGFDAGRIGQAGKFDGAWCVDAGTIADFGYYDKFSLGAWIKADSVASGTIVSRMTDVSQADGYQLCLANGKLQLNLVKRWLDDSLRVETEIALPPGEWHHVLATYDGSRVAAGVRFYIDGQPAAARVLLDELNQPFNAKDPFRIGGGGGPEGRFRGTIDEARAYRHVLTPAEALSLAAFDTLGAIAAVPAEGRSAAQNAKLAMAFARAYAPPEIREAGAEALRLRRERQALVESFPTTMVMEEMPVPRETFVLARGVYDKPVERVYPDVPAGLPALPAGAPQNRLGLARWLVQPEHPLTARVAVNRYWQGYFGFGLVNTLEDFGSQGEWPSHLELLDWLATEFVRTGWDVKAMQRLIVTSATYRQASRSTPALVQRDPDNRLLARGPRRRLSAESIRDQALYVSGLLVEKVGGPSVMPYQPAGLWNELAGIDYPQDKGENLYRRSLYTFWKRTIAPPAMITFDAAGRETCVVRETRTNTPLQALTLLNDVTYVEAARRFAQRILTEAGPSPEERLTLAFRLAVARSPEPRELQVLVRGLSQRLERYRRDPAAAEKLLAAGESPRDPRLDPAELAAYAATCSVLLNLDETITKP